MLVSQPCIFDERHRLARSVCGTDPTRITAYFSSSYSYTARIEYNVEILLFSEGYTICSASSLDIEQIRIIRQL
jgi:hypothetical protein